MRCPICDKPVVDSKARPFCSAACRSIDLGRWLDGSYRIARPHDDVSGDDAPVDRAGPDRADDAEGSPWMH